MKIISILLTIFSATVFLYAVSTQIPFSASQNGYKFTGSLRNPKNEVLVGVPLNFKSGEKTLVTSSDIWGKFSVNLPTGDYEVITDRGFSETFIAYIKIDESGINPQDVKFIIEPNENLCGDKANKGCPTIITAVKPPYPPAAKAVRAWGQVVVIVKIDPEGKVTSAIAESGHPLLRKASESAARASIFETSVNESERIVKLSYIYLPDDKQKGLEYFSNPYRIEVFVGAQFVNSVNG